MCVAVSAVIMLPENYCQLVFIILCLHLA